MIARLLAVLAVVGALAMMTNESLRHRKAMEEIAELADDVDRAVDIGVTFARIVRDPKGEQLIPDKPRVRVTERRHVGGVVDPAAVPIAVREGGSPSWWIARTEDGGIPRKPLNGERVWYLSDDQWEAVFHDDDSKLGQLVYGSMGAGKTRALAMWHYMRWVEHMGDVPARRAGQTAPTEKRLEMIRDEIMTMFPREWRKYRSDETTFIMCDGVRIELVSTYKQSAAQGSRLAGRNWSWCGRDETQDQVEEHSEIESRGRSARQDENGRVLFKQFATCTAKDDSAWRELRDMLLASGEWAKRTLSVFRSPMYTEEFIAQKARTMEPREFLRRFGDPKTGEPGDLLPELAVYYGWNRERNLVPKPQIATDVTAAILSSHPSYLYRRATGLLCAHDPGVIYNTSVVLQLLMFGTLPTWAVVGELQTKQTTQRQHAKALVAYLRDSFYVGHPRVSGPTAAVFLDPHGKGEGQTDYQSVYMAFQGEGLDAFNPAPMTGKILRKPRIEMVNRLLGGAIEDIAIGEDVKLSPPRLVIVRDQYGKAVAPKLVEAFETLRKRPGDDDPEGTQKKDEDDKTHAPAALGYALWPFEQEAYTENTMKLALAAVRHR